jgi:hypothetical protein
MRLVAIVPTYRNPLTLPDVVGSLERSGIPTIVIDDGSGDGTAQWLEQWVREPVPVGAEQMRWCECLPRNGGKGAALEVGLSLARKLGFDAALTVDADGQHLNPDALRIAGLRERGVMVVGARQERVEGYPPRSMFGRRLWALGVRSLTGLGVSDPICGLRVYPLAATESVSVRAGRYAWEEEFLVRAAWAGVEIREETITTVYQPAGVRVTHFIGRDWVEGFTAWAWLALLRLTFAVRCARPRGPLVRRDRSWRRVFGCSIAAATLMGAALPPIVAIPLASLLAWRLHAPILGAVLLTALAALAAWAGLGWVAAAAAFPLAFIGARAARPLCSS